MKNQTYRMTMLFDFTANSSPSGRRNSSISITMRTCLWLRSPKTPASPAGVRDVIVRAEGIMQEVEDKTGLIRRFEQMRGHLKAIEDAAAELKTINYRQYEDPRLTELADLIHAEATALKE